MKKLLFLAVCALATATALAQGTVNFNNRVSAASIDAPVFDVGGTTKLGPTFDAQLYAGPNAGSLAAVGSVTPFKSGVLAGYFAGGSVAISTVAPGATASIQVRAWDASGGATSYEAALAAGVHTGESAIIQVATGGVPDPTTGIPGFPANLTGLQSFSLVATVVPEPSTIALGLLGAGALLLRRRK